jgi:hypothetical protein
MVGKFGDRSDFNLTRLTCIWYTEKNYVLDRGPQPQSLDPLRRCDGYNCTHLSRHRRYEFTNLDYLEIRPNSQFFLHHLPLTFEAIDSGGPFRISEILSRTNRSTVFEFSDAMMAADISYVDEDDLLRMRRQKLPERLPEGNPPRRRPNTSFPYNILIMLVLMIVGLFAVGFAISALRTEFRDNPEERQALLARQDVRGYRYQPYPYPVPGPYAMPVQAPMMGYYFPEVQS